jgi:hypothetical protein
MAEECTRRRMAVNEYKYNNNNNNNNNIPGNYEVKELQKTAILGTAHILRKVLT